MDVTHEDNCWAIRTRAAEALTACGAQAGAEARRARLQTLSSSPCSSCLVVPAGRRSPGPRRPAVTLGIECSSVAAEASHGDPAGVPRALIKTRPRCEVGGRGRGCRRPVSLFTDADAAPSPRRREAAPGVAGTQRCVGKRAGTSGGRGCDFRAPGRDFRAPGRDFRGPGSNSPPSARRRRQAVCADRESGERKGLLGSRGVPRSVRRA